MAHVCCQNCSYEYDADIDRIWRERKQPDRPPRREPDPPPSYPLRARFVKLTCPRCHKQFEWGFA